LTDVRVSKAVYHPNETKGVISVVLKLAQKHICFEPDALFIEITVLVDYIICFYSTKFI
jgi:hypothetical protein